MEELLIFESKLDCLFKGKEFKFKLVLTGEIFSFDDIFDFISSPLILLLLLYIEKIFFYFFLI